MNLDASERARHAIKVSVLTPVFNEAAILQDVLLRMRAQEDPGGEIELIFIDGRSTDATRDILQAAAAEDPRVRVLDNPKRVTSVGLNLGLAHARGEYVARMDAHALYPVDYLEIGVERLARGDVAAVSGPQIAVGTDTWSRRIAGALSTRLGVGGSNFRRPIATEQQTDSGFTGMWRRDTIERYGGWDELAYPNEDSFLASRIREDGGRLVLVPAMAAQYSPRNSLRSLAVQYWRYGRARARTARHHRISVRPSHILPPALVLAGGASLVPGRLRRPSRALICVYFATLAGTAARSRQPSRDAVYLPAVLAVMHVSWGAGYIVGLCRPGPAVRQPRDSVGA